VSPALQLDQSIPSTRLDYVIRLLPGDYDALPEEMKTAGAIALDSDAMVLAATSSAPKPKASARHRLKCRR
jgi:hypothetical protein